MFSRRNTTTTKNKKTKTKTKTKKKKYQASFQENGIVFLGHGPKIYKAKGSCFVGRWWDGAVCKLAATPFVASILNRLRSSVLVSTAID
jgi:hypothetical protein